MDPGKPDLLELSSATFRLFPDSGRIGGPLFVQCQGVKRVFNVIIYFNIKELRKSVGFD